MPYAIINWMDTITYSDLGFVYDEEIADMPNPIAIFETRGEAENYALENLNGEYKVIEI